jgi:hypothetical protein
MRWVGHVVQMGRDMYVYVTGRKATGQGPLGRPRSRWVDNIKMDLGKTGQVHLEWIGLAQDRDKWSSYECNNEPLGSIKV